MSIPFNEPSRYVWSRKTELSLATEEFLTSSVFVLGPKVEKFEAEFAKYLGAKHCAAVGNGTDALQLALQSIPLEKNSIVGNVANAGMYSTTAILAAGHRPLFMDVQAGNYLPSLGSVLNALDAGCSAIIVTHLFGLLNPDMVSIVDVCKARGVYLIEDCAQAHGAELGGSKAGTFGDVAAFSFYPTKNLGALGDGGAVVTNDQKILKQAKSLRQYGWATKYVVELPGGMNSRLDELQAAFLLIFLKDLDVRNERRRAIAQRYLLELDNDKLKTPDIPSDKSYVAHLFCVRASEREGLRQYLADQGIGTDIHYPIPDFHQSVMVESDTPTLAALTESEQLSQEIVSLPCFPELTDSEVDRIIGVINSW